MPRTRWKRRWPLTVPSSTRRRRTLYSKGAIQRSTVPTPPSPGPASKLPRWRRARSVMFAMPELRVRFGSMPRPSSVMRMRTRPHLPCPDTSTLTVAAVAWAWRAMLDRPSRTMATTSSDRSGSTRPSNSSMTTSSLSRSELIASPSSVMSNEGANPSAERVREDSRRMRSTRPTALSRSRRLCTIVRIWRTASSMDASESSMRDSMATGSACP